MCLKRKSILAQFYHKWSTQMIKCIVIHIMSPKMNANDNDDNCNNERR